MVPSCLKAPRIAANITPALASQISSCEAHAASRAARLQNRLIPESICTASVALATLFLAHICSILSKG